MEEGEESKGRSPSPPLPPRPWDRPLFTPSPKKKPSDLPGLSNCHSCGLNCAPKAQSDKLQFLDSQWRVILLCNRCLSHIRSAVACSYCFSKISDDDGRPLGCRECSRRIHLRCAPLERGYVALSELHPDSFTCIDCCPVVRPRRRKPSTVDSGVSLEDLSRDASAAAEKKDAAAARAKEKALQKAAAASCASERARSMLGVVATGGEPALSGDQVMPDDELALQLHLAMNGSQRVSRNPRPTNLDHPVSSNNARCSKNSVGRKAESGSYSFCEKVGFSTEDGFFESMERTWLNQISSVESDSTENKDQKKGIDGFSGNSLVEVPVKEEQGGCSNGVGPITVYCQRINELNGTMVLSKCRLGARGDSFELQQKKRRGKPARYTKKYSKRH